MNPLYNFTAHITFFILKVYGLFNGKIKLFIQGRKETFEKLSILKKEDSVIWFHAASLGEFEQARPIIEEVKKKYANHKIVVTFFSPSGYEIQKNYNLADIICYLPFDTKGRVRKFIKMVHPEMAIIVKYEFWPNLLNELNNQNITTILVSGIFRKDQPFFKKSGKWMKKSLSAFHHFFVQNQLSKELLESIGYSNTTVCGDTRLDRVGRILEQDNSVDVIQEFKNNQYTIVAGSTWKEDEELLVNYINQTNDQKLIIAPHTMEEKAIQELKNSIQKRTILYSEIPFIITNAKEQLKEYEVFIIDTIGLLTKIYSYADVAYVGGAFKTGLHNILEPATFGIPVVIGPEYDKFNEAVDLVRLKGCISVSNQQEFSEVFDQLKEDTNFRKNTGKINQKYIQDNKGATKEIMNYINTKINN
ncbi:glycosyltransferase N-terminal domain-containing protein [Pseudotenacibaculum sp. MALMAid0570]|uniref:3-deoxy-D-manno-octulosonic acid transferase n=1 Tax=Pseudotenacibaculum sp. MALMAid0570 TaxID=3143938 RepID=UPI0032DEE1AD